MFTKLRSYLAAASVALALGGGVLGMLLAPAALQAQPYPTNNPTYSPNPLLPPTLIPTAQGSSFPFLLNGTETIYVRVFGAPSGLSAYIQGTTERVSGVGQPVAQTVTISNASPAVVTAAAHGLSVNQAVVFTTTGALPAGLTAGTTYYVIPAGFTTGAYEVALTPGGTAINTTNAGSGTHTATANAPFWSNLPVDKVGGPLALGAPRQTQINSAGLYRINIGGYSQVRLNVQALTSGVTYFDAAAGPGLTFVTTAPNLRNSYSAAAQIATGATNHFLVLPGNATTTVRVTGVICSGRATLSVTLGFTAEVDSTADTGDAGTALASTPHDSNNPAAASVALSHTTSPTPGALVGLIGAGAIHLGNVLDSATAFPTPTEFKLEFGTRAWEQEIVLRGATQSFSLNSNAAFGGGGIVGCRITWTEELN